MDNLLFSNSFNFNTFRLEGAHYTDSRGGSPYHYIGFLKKGSAKIVYSQGTLHLNEGDCFYIPLNLSYRSYWQGDPKIVFDSYGFTFFPNSENKKFRLQKINSDSALELLSQVKTNQNHSCINIGKFYLALGEIITNMTASYENKHDEIIIKATEYFKNNPNSKVPEVAKYCGVSESGFYSICKQIKGCTPTQIKQKIFVEKATQLLCSTDLKIEIIAEKCNFSSSIYFRKIFKKITGQTPSQVRKHSTP